MLGFVYINRNRTRNPDGFIDNHDKTLNQKLKSSQNFLNLLSGVMYIFFPIYINIRSQCIQ